MYRFADKGVQVLCEDFQCLDTGFRRGPASTFHHIFVHFLAILFCGGSKTMYGICLDFFKWIFFWIKYLDVVWARYEFGPVINCTIYFLGRKQAANN